MLPLPAKHEAPKKHRRRAIRGWAVAVPVSVAGCGGPQSVLSPAGLDAQQVFGLFLVMFGGAVVLWIALNGLFFYVTRIKIGRMSRKLAEAIIIGGGVVLPLIVLSTLVAFSLPMMPDQRRPGGDLEVRVTGERWWWRVEYWPQGAEEPIVSANEIRLPVGRRSDFALTSAKVIHSFWIPVLGGKLDMFPGRVTSTSLEPTTPGLYRGQCAEFCGASHALMAFETVVLPEDEFAAWLEAAAEPAAAPEGGAAIRGAQIFAREGCGACHTVRGTEARGNVGPDLTHVGSRHSLGAGILGTEVEDFARWIGLTQAIKPEVEMPSYDHLPEEDLLALGEYLTGLQ